MFNTHCSQDTYPWKRHSSFCAAWWQWKTCLHCEYCKAHAGEMFKMISDQGRKKITWEREEELVINKCGYFKLTYSKYSPLSLSVLFRLLDNSEKRHISKRQFWLHLYPCLDASSILEANRQMKEESND